MRQPSASSRVSLLSSPSLLFQNSRNQGYVGQTIKTPTIANGSLPHGKSFHTNNSVPNLSPLSCHEVPGPQSPTALMASGMNGAEAGSENTENEGLF